MVWAKFDQHLPENKKFRRLSPSAQLMYFKAICFANTHRTDGHLSADRVTALSYFAGADPVAVAPELLNNTMWEADRNGNGWWIHDYARYQPVVNPQARETELARQRANRAERMAARTLVSFSAGQELTPLTFPSQFDGNSNIDPSAMATLRTARKVS